MFIAQPIINWVCCNYILDEVIFNSGSKTRCIFIHVGSSIYMVVQDKFGATNTNSHYLYHIRGICLYNRQFLHLS